MMGTPDAATWAVIFSSKLAADAEGYEATAHELLESARVQPGFLGVESVRDPDTGFGITVSYWASEEAIAAWREHAEHSAARRQGRARWYEQFDVRVCRVERAYSFVRPRAATSPGER